MKKLLIIGLSLLIPLAIKPMEDPEETKKATKFEEFQQLPEPIQKQEILLQQFLFRTAQKDSLKDAINNIKNAILVDKSWNSLINTEEMINNLVDMMLQNPKIQNFFKQFKIEKGDSSSGWKQYIDDTVKKNLLLVAFKTKVAEDLFVKLNNTQTSSISEEKWNVEMIASLVDLIADTLEGNELTPSLKSDLFYILPNIFEFADSKKSPVKVIQVIRLLDALQNKYPAEYKNFLSLIKDLKSIKALRAQYTNIRKHFEKLDE